MATQILLAPKHDAPGAPRTRGEHRDSGPAWGLLAPFTVLYLAFLIGPTVYGLVMSFFDTSLVRPGLSGFAGLDNYGAVLSSADFWASMWHTVWFTILTTPPLVVLALVLAILTDRLRRGRWFFRLVFFAPFVVPVSVAGLVFAWLYAPEIGLYGTWLGALGLPTPGWLSDPAWSIPGVALLTVWWTIGFNFVLYLAGLQDIPRDVYEAAAIDGAGPWARMWRITVPMLRRTTLLILLLQIVASLKVFGQIYSLFNGASGPDNAARPVLQFILDTGFTDYRAGYGAAASMVYLTLIVLAALAWFLVSSRRSRRA